MTGRRHEGIRSMRSQSNPSSAEVFRALGVLCEPPADGHARVAQAVGLPAVPEAPEYTDVFVFHLYPYASVYLGPEGMLGGEARDRVAGFWRALRLAPPAEPDHLAALLGLYASLADREEDDEDPARRLLWRQARTALLYEHLVSWLPPYLDRVEALGSPAYRAWAVLLRSALGEETAAAGEPGVLSAHLRAAAALPDPRCLGSRAFVTGLLAPVRCGMILTRADLARGARRLGLGLRMGERTFTLAALLSQAPDAVLGWLAEEAEVRAARYPAHRPMMGPMASFWTERAQQAAHLLRQLRDSAAAEAADSHVAEVTS
jgi:TorA maturation chaperone TorD